MSFAPVLAVENLHTHIPTPEGIIRAVNGVSFQIRPGRVLGLVGESGCGKSITCLSVLGLLNGTGRVINGRIRLKGRDILDLPPEEMRKIRGKEIGMIMLYFITFFIGPVVISSLGWSTGVTYLSIYLGINLLVSGVGLLMGKLLLPLPEQGKEEDEQSREAVREPWREKLIVAARRTLPAFRRLALVFMPVTLLVSILLHTPLMDQMMRQVNPALNYLGLPGVTIIVITTGVMSMIAGIGTLKAGRNFFLVY